MLARVTPAIVLTSVAYAVTAVDQAVVSLRGGLVSTAEKILHSSILYTY